MLTTNINPCKPMSTTVKVDETVLIKINQSTKSSLLTRILDLADIQLKMRTSPETGTFGVWSKHKLSLWVGRGRESWGD